MRTQARKETTVGELIRLLQQYSLDLPVVLENEYADEGIYSNIRQCNVIVDSVDNRKKLEII